MTHKPTEEQLAILDAGKAPDNIAINAYAGTGKTSTLEMLEAVVPQSPILYLVFNKRNADEATKRMGLKTTVRTFNSFGHRIWASTVSNKLVLDGRKTNSIFKEIVDETRNKRDRDDMWDAYEVISHGVNMAKALGYVPAEFHGTAKPLISADDFFASLEEQPDDLVIDLIDGVLVRSIRRAYKGQIDFNDQIYMPAVFGGIFPQFPLTLIDEAQDMSPVNHAMINKLAKGRLIIVGDPYQAIYGFRGAVQSGMSELIDRHKMATTSLSVSFRCPQAIVENARWRVPNFKWVRHGGKVEYHEKGLPMANIPDGAAVICRNNAPLFATAMRFITEGRSVSVAGTEIGQRLVKTLKGLGDGNLSRTAALGAIQDWLAAKQEKQSKTAEDMAACMEVFVKMSSTLGQAVSYAEHLFAQEGKIQFMTGHKSKGLEFDHVVHIDPWIIKNGEQDKNLRYVIQTRSKNYYCEVDSVRIEA